MPVSFSGEDKRGVQPTRAHVSVRELGAAITARASTAASTVASTVASTARVQSRTEKETTNIGERK